MKAVRITSAGLAAITGLIIGGCGTTDQVRYEPRPMYAAAHATTFGVIDSIDVVRTGGGDNNVAAGTILGGIVGGVLGHQIGGGRGNDVATVAGAIGGAVVGHEIAENRSAGSTYRIRVRLDNGGYQSFLQGDLDSLRVGDHVQINNDRVFRYATSGGRYDTQGNRFDGRGIRYDAQGFWLDEHGIRHEYQDAPRAYQTPLPN